MKQELAGKIEKIVSVPNLPMIFATILKDKAIFTDGEDILDFVFIEREGYEISGPFIQKYPNWQPAILVLLTTCGITIVEEGGAKVADDLYGYMITHLVYSRIASIELDVSLLSGKLIISTAGIKDGDTIINFNTAVYYKDFERIINLIREKMLK